MKLAKQDNNPICMHQSTKIHKKVKQRSMQGMKSACTHAFDIDPIALHEKIEYISVMIRASVHLYSHSQVLVLHET